MGKCWILTARNESNEGDIAVVRTTVKDDPSSATLTVVTNESAQYKVRVALTVSGVAASDVVKKEARNAMKDDEWLKTLKTIFLGEPDAYKKIEDGSSYIVKWSSNGDELVLAIKLSFAANKNVTISLGKVVCAVASKGSSSKTLNKLLQMYDDFYSSVASEWTKQNLRAQNEIDRLKEQVKQLTEAKLTYDEEIMNRFTLLLNTKKAKISELSGNGSTQYDRIPTIKREFEELQEPEPESKSRLSTEPDIVEDKVEVEVKEPIIKEEPIDIPDEIEQETPSTSEAETTEGETDSD
ncbi:hypothetical protein AWJ20_1236 [Sugiyamaella lignohabitans]|uniref:Uncharacterized protein n=1 Tax=Sugiyamaella lignohabitans TaxID=796027 RepID=A0A167DIN3_9ASCO|nr:uncharacterized protein AWJ20_1236 [Sugiyamaella lignohabitans]ANB12958.1 hypothetical protein AWJ20_1236 [Sugiyamaella lignohabitans]